MEHSEKQKKIIKRRISVINDIIEELKLFLFLKHNTS